MRHRILLVWSTTLATGCTTLKDFDVAKPVCYETDVVTSELTQDSALIDRNTMLADLGSRPETSSEVSDYWLYSLVGVGLVTTGIAVVGLQVAGLVAMGELQIAPVAGGAVAGGLGLVAVKKSDERLTTAMETHNGRVGARCP